MDLKKLDCLVNVAFINFYTVGKDTQKVLLTNINIKDKRHLACIHIAKLINDIYGYEFYVPNNLIKYWKLNRKCKSKKWLKRIKSISTAKEINVEDFISHIEKANEEINGFEEVYDEYFGVYDR